jgi:NAD(P)-dependent dehydrogenase (short-subunit alcohol dehydrogenase family)
MRLKNRVVMVTGASGGIGSSIAKAFARKKCDLILHAKNETSVKEMRKRLKNLKAACMFVHADFKKVGEVSKMFNKIRKECNHLDILVNVSGIEKIYVDPLDTREWKDLLDVNLFGAVECSREAVKIMGDRGVIINISSIAGKVGIAFTGSSLPYAISKAALNAFSENLAAMLAPRIRVVAISPGYTLTPMWEMYTEEEKEDCLRDVLLRRFVTPSEVAQTVIAVAENDAITATNIVVDAGLTLKEIK